MTTEERLRSLLEAATPGPWHESASFIYERRLRDENAAALRANKGGNFVASTLGSREVRYANAALIVEAVNALPKLLAVVAAARGHEDERIPCLCGCESTMRSEDATLRAALVALDAEP